MSLLKKISLLLIIPVFTIFLLWQFAALKINSSLILPSPKQVFISFFDLIQKAFFWEQVGFTLFRSILSFFYSLCISIVLGIAIGFSKNISLLLQFPLSIIKATPVVSFILLALFWFSTSQVPVFVSVLMTIPIITSSLAHGISTIDKNLIEMAKIYNFTFKQRWISIYIPSIFPSFASGSLSAFGLTWKVIVASEVISLPKRALGTALQTAKVHIETADVFAISIVIIALSFVFELFLSFLFSIPMKWRTKNER